MGNRHYLSPFHVFKDTIEVGGTNDIARLGKD